METFKRCIVCECHCVPHLQSAAVMYTVDSTVCRLLTLQVHVSRTSLKWLKFASNSYKMDPICSIVKKYPRVCRLGRLLWGMFLWSPNWNDIFHLESTFFQFHPDESARKGCFIFLHCPWWNSFLPEESHPCFKSKAILTIFHHFNRPSWICSESFLERVCLSWGGYRAVPLLCSSLRRSTTFQDLFLEEQMQLTR